MDLHQRPLPSASRVLLYAIYVAIAVFVATLATGCANGLIGKNTNKNIAALNTTVRQTDSTVSRLITDSRGDILDYIKNGTRKTTRDISIGILEGTIGYVDDSANRRNLIALIDELIDHAGSHSRAQLIAFRDELINQHFIDQVSRLAHELMRELIVQPGTDLINVVLGSTTRKHLDAILRMPIVALLNDSAIGQIGKLRDVLLGIGMRRNIAGLVDTALVTLNARLDTPLRHTIIDIVQQASKKVGQEGKNDVNSILYVIIGGILLIAIVMFVLQQLKLRQKNQMLYSVTREIEDFRKTNTEANFQQLTGQIRERMLDQGLEGKLRKFLYETGINKTT
jgi:hypothetical protein